jgi:Leucine-rich repeat (LRR) protein
VWAGLSVGRNKLQQLPASTFASDTLRILHVQHNAITDLPPLGPAELAACKLRVLWLSGNPIAPQPNTEPKPATIDLLAALPELTELRCAHTPRARAHRRVSATPLVAARPARPAATRRRQRLHARRMPRALSVRVLPSAAAHPSHDRIAALAVRASKRDGMPERSNSVDDLLDQKRSQKSIGASPEPNRALGSPSANRAAGSDGEKSPQRTSVAKRSTAPRLSHRAELPPTTASPFAPPSSVPPAVLGRSVLQ